MQEHSIHLLEQLKRTLGTIFIQLISIALLVLLLVGVSKCAIEKQTESINELNKSVKEAVVETVKEEPEKSPIEEIVIIEEEKAENQSWYHELTEEEIRDFAALVYLEAGSCSRECQLAIASVIVNIMKTTNTTFYETAYKPNQFEPANRIKSTKPSDLSMECTLYVLQNGPTIDEYVCFFRNCFYFSWATPYMNIDNVYFSFDTRVREQVLCKG